MPERPPSIRELYRALDRCTIADARRLHARLRGLERHDRHLRPAATPAPATTEPPSNGHPPAEAPRGPQSFDRALAQIVEQIERSIARVEMRRAAVPPVTYPADLPVAARKDEIIAAIREHQVTVVCGATGSGKTTQLPKMLLELGRGCRGWIGHTQPRRIAARSVAARIAHELGGQLGGVVGYKVRFTDQTSDRSLVKLMTDGILLAETQHDRYLSQYDTLIIDEAHERSLNIDFLLGYLRQLLPRRPDLKLVITSATIDPRSFAEHFTLPGGKPVPIVEVSGRTYPVDVRYRPLEAQHEDEEDRDLEGAILHAVDELSSAAVDDPAGDILVFLPGEREIRETAEALRKHPLRPAHRVDVIPLYARLSTDEQQRVFDPHPGRRRIVLATNVAETSLTVPGIKYVIDSGLARISRYSPRIKVQRLPIEPISRASANQRSGRSGRTSPGVAIRLYSEENFNARPEFTDPEILRTNLASVILQMKALDLGDIEDFPFIQPPGPQAVRDGYDTLLEINALESGGLRMDLTPIGRTLARLPIDPRIGRMLLAAEGERCLSEVLVIAAALSTQDPRERPIDKAAEADAAHALFREEGSDFLSQLKLWRELHKQQKAFSGSAFRRWCKAKYVSYLRFREWHDTHHQLRELMTEMGHRPNPPARPARPEAIHRALLTGLLSNIGRKNDKSAREVAMGEPEYDGARGLKFNLFPGSVLFKRPAAADEPAAPPPPRGSPPGEGKRGGPKWVMAAEIVKTTRTYARTAASISPAWIEPAAAHLVKRTYKDPHWNADLAQACAFETVTLYGLEIVKGRRVSYADIDPAVSRALFIQHALVNGEYLSNAKFFEHNHTLTQKVRHAQAKARTNDLLADQVTRYSFYDRRLPPDVATGPRFEEWRRRAESREPELLVMKAPDVLAPGATLPAPEEYPESIVVGAVEDARGRRTSEGRRLALEYRYDPGHAEDGLTLIVPIDALPDVSQSRLDWLVPGFLEEKVETLLRELPKGLRTSFVPIPQTAATAARKLAALPHPGDFYDALTSTLNAMTGVHVPRSDWRPDRLPAHLVMNLRVLDASGKPAFTGRDLGAIRRELAGQAEGTLYRLPEGEHNRAGVFHWDFGPLPESVEVRHDGRPLTLHPALTDEGSATDVAIRPYTNPERAKEAHAQGLRRLFYLHTRRECRSLIENTPGIERLGLLYQALAAAPYAGARPGDAPRRPTPGRKAPPAPAALVECLAELTAHRAWDAPSAKAPLTDIRTREAFEAKLNDAWTRIGSSGAEVFVLAESLLTEHMAIAPTLERDDLPPAWSAALLDIRVQLAYLFVPGFWTRTPYAWLKQFPRYLAAIRRRLERLAISDELAAVAGGGSGGGGGGVARDTRLLNEVQPYWHQLRIRVEQGTAAARSHPDLVQYRWMIEEFRVALWGQDQRTVVPVSPKRLEQQWAKVIAKD